MDVKMKNKGTIKQKNIHKILPLLIANSELLYIYIINQYLIIELIDKLPKDNINEHRISLLKNMSDNNIILSQKLSDNDIDNINSVLIEKDIPQYKKKLKVKCTYDNLNKINLAIINNFMENIHKIEQINRNGKTSSISRKKSSTKKIGSTKKKNIISKKSIKVKEKNSKKKIKGQIAGTHGAYLDRLSSKGQQPITGDDVSRTIQEISELLNMLRYVPEGQGATPFAVMFDLLQGQEQSMEYYLKFNVFPKYGKLFPPTINFNELSSALNNISEYLNLYTTYNNTIKQSRVERGEVIDMTPTSLDKMANKLSTARNKYFELSRVTDINSKLLI